MNLESVFRKLLVYNFFIFPNIFIVSEYPKSGGSWLTHMISEYFELPFFRNEMPKLKSSIMHGHYRYFPTMRNVIILDRDGRDIMVSFYFHSFFKNELFNEKLVNRMRSELIFEDYDDIESNLPKFIEYKFTRKRPPRFTWSEFVESWREKEVCRLKYEDLLIRPVHELESAIKYLAAEKPDRIKIDKIVQKYSFKNLAKREPGKEDRKSFIRKGIAGDWKSHFSKASREIFDHYAGGALIELGYEKDHSWV